MVKAYYNWCYCDKEVIYGVNIGVFGQFRAAHGHGAVIKINTGDIRTNYIYVRHRRF